MAKWLQEPEYQRMSALRLAGEILKGDNQVVLDVYNEIYKLKILAALKFDIKW